MLLSQYIKIYSLELLRNKSAAFFTIFFPTMLLLLFGRQGDTTSLGQWHMFVAMSNYAVQSSMFLALGMSIAYAKNSKWIKYMSTLPVPPSYRISGQIISMAFFALLSLSFVVFVGLFWLTISINLKSIAWMVVSALIGGVPMGFLAVCIAYLVSETTARSIFVVLNLLLFFASFSLPVDGVLGYMRFFVPSYEWFSLSTSLTLQQPIEWVCLLGLISYTFVFYMFSIRLAKRA